MGCCSSKRAVTVGVKEVGTTNAKNDKDKVGSPTHDNENTGISLHETSSATVSKENKENAVTNRSGQLKNSSSFTITPKYTTSLTASASNTDLNNRNNNASNSSLTFLSPSDNQENSKNLLSPTQTNNLTSSTYSTDHLRASPYASSIENRKKYSTVEKNPFRGFGTPVPDKDSGSDGFDSDIETEVNLPGRPDQTFGTGEDNSLASFLVSKD